MKFTTFVSTLSIDHQTEHKMVQSVLFLRQDWLTHNSEAQFLKLW